MWSFAFDGGIQRLTCRAISASAELLVNHCAGKATSRHVVWCKGKKVNAYSSCSTIFTATATHVPYSTVALVPPMSTMDV